MIIKQNLRLDLAPYTPRLFYQGMIQFGVLFDLDRKHILWVYNNFYLVIEGPYRVNRSLTHFVDVDRHGLSEEPTESIQDLVPLLNQVLS